MEATHFIEVVKGKCQRWNEPVRDIVHLESDLEDTRIFCWETIAIFKIKLK